MGRNTVNKEEIACNKQFLLFPQSFQKTCTADTKKIGLVWEMGNRLKAEIELFFFYVKKLT